VAVALLVCRSQALSDQQKLSAVTSFVSANKISSVVALVCQAQGESGCLAHFLRSHTFRALNNVKVNKLCYFM
jgi:TctA family transporter